MPHPLKLKLTNRETETTIDILEKAITYHQDWLTRFHESLVCGSPFTNDVYRKDAHRHCKLGQWYYQHAPDALKGFEEFSQLDTVHHSMHDLARLLAEKSDRGTPILPDEYSAFHHNQQQLIQLLGALRDQLITLLYSFDPLTGALNRDAFFLIAEKEHALAKRTRSSYTIAMIDLDHFKQINDEYGHVAGDQVLQDVAKLFTRRLRSSDTFSRFGGEEFIAFLPDTRLQDAAGLFDSILKALADTAIALGDNGKTLQVTASVGLAEQPEAAELDAVIELADNRLYHAKTSGRNQVCYFIEPD